MRSMWTLISPLPSFLLTSYFSWYAYSQGLSPPLVLEYLLKSTLMFNLRMHFDA